MPRKGQTAPPTSTETRKKISAKARLRDHSRFADIGRTQAQLNRGKRATLEHREKISAGHKRRSQKILEEVAALGLQGCRGCERLLPFDAFPKQKDKALGIATKCRECRVKQTKAWTLANPEKTTTYARKARAGKYGITLEDREAIYARQGGKCGICRDPIELYGRGSHIDHCHKTGAVRGLLCGPCNRGLGLFFDRVDSFRNAVDYLTAEHFAVR